MFWQILAAYIALSIAAIFMVRRSAPRLLPLVVVGIALVFPLLIFGWACIAFCGYRY